MNTHTTAAIDSHATGAEEECSWCSNEATAFDADGDPACEGCAAAHEREQDAAAASAAIETEDGEYCVYWRSTDEHNGPRGRYATREEAEAVARHSQRKFEGYHPGGSALCGFEVRVLVDGEWSEIEDES